MVSVEQRISSPWLLVFQNHLGGYLFVSWRKSMQSSGHLAPYVCGGLPVISHSPWHHKQAIAMMDGDPFIVCEQLGVRRCNIPNVYYSRNIQNKAEDTRWIFSISNVIESHIKAVLILVSFFKIWYGLEKIAFLNVRALLSVWPYRRYTPPTFMISSYMLVSIQTW